MDMFRLFCDKLENLRKCVYGQEIGVIGLFSLVAASTVDSGILFIIEKYFIFYSTDPREHAVHATATLSP